MNKRVQEKAWNILNGLRGNIQITDAMPIFVGALLIIDKATADGDVLISTIGNKNANVTVAEIKDYASRLENTEKYPDGIFSAYAFSLLDKIDSIAFCEFFIHIKNLYEELEETNRGFVILNSIFDCYYSSIGKLAGEFGEQECLRKLVCELATVEDGQSVYDPCTGAAGYASTLYNAFGKKIAFVGDEINSEAFYLGHAVLILGHVNDYCINMSNSILSPKTVNEHLQLFDRVVTAHPISVRLSENDYEVVQNDLYGRFHYGMPSKGNADWLFIETAISSLKSDGKAVVVTSMGPLFRSIEGKIRESILNEDILEAVIQLPAGLMYGASIPLCVLVFNKNKPVTMKEKTISIDASELGYQPEGKKSKKALSDEDILKIVEMYENPFDELGFSRIFTAAEIKERDYNFNLPSICRSESAAEKLDGYIALSEVADEVTRGVQITPKALEGVQSERGTHYLLNLSNLDNGKIKVTSDNLIEPQKKWIKNYEVNAGDLLVAARGTFKCAVVPKDLPKSIASGNLIIVRLKKTYSPYVLEYFLNSELGLQLIAQIQSGVAAPIINADALAKLMIPGIEACEMNKLEIEILDYSREYERRIAEANEFKASAEKVLNDAMRLEMI